MARMRAMVVLGVLAVCLVACGGAAPRSSVEPTASDDGCGPRGARIAGACWSAVGTRWRVTTETSAGVDELDLELMAAGRVRSSDHGDASPAHDEWFQEGATLRVFLADRFVEYRATVTNGTVLVGEAINVRGQRWPWRAVRVFGEAACATGEARFEGACMTVAGTRWRIEGDERIVELLRDGLVASSSADPSDDRWTQENDRVRFSIGAQRFEGTLIDERTLRGTREGAGAFTASRVESIPPPVR
jgi:hypothetical protein